MVDLIPHTRRRPMTRARAARIFLRENGRCYCCGRKLRIGVDKYQIEHPEALSLGGSDDDAALRVICDACHKPKTAADANAKAKRDRLVTASWQPEEPRRSKWARRPLGNGNNQRTATTPPTKLAIRRSPAPQIAEHEDQGR